MNKLEFPIVKIESDIFQVKINLSLYDKEAVAAICYNHSGSFFVHQEMDGDCIIVTLQSKEKKDHVEQQVKQFCNDLIDQQIRCNIEKEFGHIRNLIVEEAFKPVNSKK